MTFFWEYQHMGKASLKLVQNMQKQVHLLYNETEELRNCEEVDR